MSVPDDAFELIRDLRALERKAREIGDPDLIELAKRVSDRASSVSEKLAEVWDTVRETQIDASKAYRMKKKV